VPPGVLALARGPLVPKGLESGLPDECLAWSRKARQPQSLKLSSDYRLSLEGADRQGVVDETQPAKRVQPPQLRTASQPQGARITRPSWHRDSGYILVIALTRVCAREAHAVRVARPRRPTRSSSVYAKLGIGSRTRLARRLGASA